MKLFFHYRVDSRAVSVDPPVRTLPMLPNKICENLSLLCLCRRRMSLIPGLPLVTTQSNIAEGFCCFGGLEILMLFVSLSLLQILQPSSVGPEEAPALKKKGGWAEDGTKKK